MIPRTLRMQLLGAILLVILLSSAITVAVAGALTRRATERAVLRDVSQQADLIAERERVALLPLGHLQSLRSFLARQDERVVVVPLGRPSPYLPGDAALRVRAGANADGTLTADGRAWFFAAREVAGSALVLLRPRVVGAAAWRPYLEGLLIAAALAGLLAAAVSFVLARRISRPLRRLADATRRVAAGQKVAVPAEGPTELASLAESFNEMATRLEHARDAERAFLLSVSHELKTPLTPILGYAEALRDGTVEVEEAARTMTKEAERLDRLIRDVLDLARMNRTGFSVREEVVDLGELAYECARRYDSFGVDVVVDADENAGALGDADRILQALSNLVENALRVLPSGGAVRIVARPGLAAVEDDGPGLQPDELAHAFERFFLHSRYAGKRAVGTGLGLAIVQELASAMNGRVAVESRPGRTRFSILLPNAATPRETTAAARSIAGAMSRSRRGPGRGRAR
jgi:signal transduction histidine kinase